MVDMKNMMKAARIYGANDFRIDDIEIPEIDDNEILLRVKAAAVCGTDLRMIQNGIDETNAFYPLTLGHEFSGIIEKTGSNVKDYAVNQRVCVAPNIGCGVCDICTSGNSHHCKKRHTIGLDIDGAFAEFVKIPADAVLHGNITPLPDNISYEAAAANEAFACVFNAFERYGFYPGETALIIGAGAIGLMHAALVLMAGASKVFLNDLSEERLAICKNIEPRLITIAGDPTEIINVETNNKGVDLVITACSSVIVQEEAFSYAALNGRINFFGGLPSGRTINADTNIIHYKQLSVSGTTRSSHDHYRKALGFIEKNLVDVDSFVTHRFPIDRIDEAIENASNQRGLKQAIVFE